MTAIERVRRALTEMPAVRLAVLFGSMARGTANARSDMDLAVSVDAGADLSPAMAATIERAAGMPVSITRLDDAPPLLRFEIARDGQVLVAREPHAWVEFKAHALIDWWDWEPTARLVHRIVRERLREEAKRGPS